jgi:hypothetical protein
MLSPAVSLYQQTVMEARLHSSHDASRLSPASTALGAEPPDHARLASAP